MNDSITQAISASFSSNLLSSTVLSEQKMGFSGACVMELECKWEPAGPPSRLFIKNIILENLPDEPDARAKALRNRQSYKNEIAVINTFARDLRDIADLSTAKTYNIINSCSVNVERGEIVSILGPNGAGKSTAMKAMLGLLNLKSGSIIIDGKDISNLSPQDRVKEGISFVPQTKNVFAGMTVEENLEMGAFLIDEDYKKIIDEIYNLFPILKEKRNQLVGELSGGQRQQVALGRALMIKPSVLMLDEPTAGVSPIVMDELFDHIVKVKRTNVAILMVEQNAKQALNISDRGYVLVTGENRYSGTGKELLNDPRVRSSFLGG